VKCEWKSLSCVSLCELAGCGVTRNIGCVWGNGVVLLLMAVCSQPPVGFSFLNFLNKRVRGARRRGVADLSEMARGTVEV